MPVDCPDGFVLTVDQTDCEPVPMDQPDAGVISEELTCEDLDCDDGDECTVDGCADATCNHEPAEDGTACTVDDGPGLCLGGQCFADCSKQDCRPVYPCTEQGIRDAVRDGGNVIIGCESPTTVTLTEGELRTDAQVSLDGLGNLTIDGNQTDRVLYVAAPAVVELRGTAITGGVAPATYSGGVAVAVGAELTLRECRIFGNLAGQHGGGLGNAGITTIIDSELFENAAERRGGAIWNGGNLTLIDSVVSGNHALDDGGGIYNTNENGRVALERSVVKENLAEDAGGGIWTSGPMIELKDSAVIDNKARGGAGGIRLWHSATVRATDSTIARNVADREGGGILNDLGVVILEHTLVAENSSATSGGAIYNAADSILEVVDSMLMQNDAAHGGAVYSVRATARFVRSAVVGNEASGLGGAFRLNQRGPSSFDLSLINCSLSGNKAGETGGGIANHRARVQFVHSTVAGNDAPLGSAIHQSQDGVCELLHSAVHGGCTGDEEATYATLGFNAVLDLGPETCVLSGSE
ncbi:MAG TPA: hypothetical protein VLS88_14310, partial [Polyangiales bacterium]|nr:hypothetical protein [Polyangiales bacterium]